MNSDGGEGKKEENCISFANAKTSKKGAVTRGWKPLFQLLFLCIKIIEEVL